MKLWVCLLLIAAAVFFTSAGVWVIAGVARTDTTGRTFAEIMASVMLTIGCAALIAVWVNS